MHGSAEFDQLHVGRGLVTALDETFDSRNEVFDVFEVVVVGIRAFVPLMFVVAGLCGLLVFRGLFVRLVAAACQLGEVLIFSVLNLAPKGLLILAPLVDRLVETMTVCVDGVASIVCEDPSHLAS